MATTIEVLEERVRHLTQIVETQSREINELRTEVQKMEDEMAQIEKRRLVWGISALGTVVATLAGIIWSYRGVIFK